MCECEGWEVYKMVLLCQCHGRDWCRWRGLVGSPPFPRSLPVPSLLPVPPIPPLLTSLILRPRPTVPSKFSSIKANTSIKDSICCLHPYTLYFRHCGTWNHCIHIYSSAIEMCSFSLEFVTALIFPNANMKTAWTHDTLSVILPCSVEQYWCRQS